MNGTDLFLAIGDAAEQYAGALAASRTRSRRKVTTVIWIAASLAVGCAAIGTAVGWKLQHTDPMNTEQIMSQYGYIEQSAEELSNRPLWEVSLAAQAYPLSDGAKTRIDANVDREGLWETNVETLEDAEALFDVHFLSMPEKAVREVLTFTAKKSGDDYLVIGHWSDSDIGWATLVTAALSTKGGAVDELKGLLIADEPDTIQKTQRIEALGTDAILFFRQREVPVQNTNQSLMHNSVIALFHKDGIAYAVHFSLNYGESLTAEDAMDRAAALLNRFC